MEKPEVSGFHSRRCLRSFDCDGGQLGSVAGDGAPPKSVKPQPTLTTTKSARLVPEHVSCRGFRHRDGQAQRCKCSRCRRGARRPDSHRRCSDQRRRGRQDREPRWRTRGRTFDMEGTREARSPRSCSRPRWRRGSCGRRCRRRCRRGCPGREVVSCGGGGIPPLPPSNRDPAYRPSRSRSASSTARWNVG